MHYADSLVIVFAINEQYIAFYGVQKSPWMAVFNWFFINEPYQNNQQQPVVRWMRYTPNMHIHITSAVVRL